MGLVVTEFLKKCRVKLGYNCTNNQYNLFMISVVKCLLSLIWHSFNFCCITRKYTQYKINILELLSLGVLIGICNVIKIEFTKINNKREYVLIVK